MDERREFELRRDSVIRPPVARISPVSPAPGLPDAAPPWEDLYRDADRERRTVEAEKRELVDFASQVCSLCLSLAKMLIDSGHDAVGADQRVTIPRELHRQTIGAGLRTGQDAEGNPFVMVKERGRERIAPVE